jgi:hypothetical protein
MGFLRIACFSVSPDGEHQIAEQMTGKMIRGRM